MAIRKSNRPRQSFGQHSKAWRDRYYREAAERYGQSKRSARDQFNRGAANVLSRDAGKRIPRSVQQHPEKYPRYVETLYAQDRSELLDNALAKYDQVFGTDFAYLSGGYFTVIENLGHADDATLVRIAGASRAELESWAQFQKKETYTFKKGTHRGKRQRTPSWVTEAGWMADGKWHNVFWYHAA